MFNYKPKDKFYTKFNCKRLNLIYNNINNYQSNIYNTNSIFKLINKKQSLINNYINLNKTLLRYLKYTKKDKNYNIIILNKIIDLGVNILDIENKLKKIEWEEDLIIKSFKISIIQPINDLKHILYRLKNKFN